MISWIRSFVQLSAALPRIGISTTVSHYNPRSESDIIITYDSGRKNSIEVNSLNK